MAYTDVQKKQSTYSKEDLDATVKLVQKEGISEEKVSKHLSISLEKLWEWANTALNSFEGRSGHNLPCSRRIRRKRMAMLS